MLAEQKMQKEGIQKSIQKMRSSRSEKTSGTSSLTTHHLHRQLESELTTKPGANCSV